MSTPTADAAVGGRSRRRPAIVIPSIIVLAFAALFVLSATSAVAHPSYGQPCHCHTPSQTATVTLKASAAKVHPAVSVKLNGKVSGNPTWTSVRVQKRLGTAAWKTFKTASLSSAAYAASWKAPAKKGTYSFRTVYLGDNHLKKATSAIKKVKVY
jgi:hypothetical protein